MKRTRENEDDIFSFYIVTPAGESIPFESKIVSQEGTSFNSPSKPESVDYGLYFRPPIRGAELYIIHVLLEGVPFFSTPLFPTEKDQIPETFVLMDKIYHVFETHQLCQDPDGELTYAVYIQFDNVVGNKKQLAVDMTLQYLPKLFKNRFKRVPFFPYDVDPAMYGLKIEPQKIPQRTPLWFKLRSEVTGSKAYKLMGFWVPTKAENPNWKYDVPEVFSEQSKTNIRMGTHSEEYAFMLLLLNNPNLSLELTGMCPCPPNAGVPIGWSASPDGLLIDADMTWETIPESISKHIQDRTLFDPRRGVMEIKASSKKLTMEAYFYPQVYMEMIATNAMWCDVVRYKKSSSFDSVSGTWVTSHIARVYRIYRHEPTVQTLIKMIKRSYNNRHALQDTVAEESYVTMRKYFADLASVAAYKEITLCNAKMEEFFSSYERYKKQLISSVDTSFTIPSGMTKKSKVDLSDINTRHQRICDNPTNANVILDQIQAYVSLLQSLNGFQRNSL